MKWTNRTLIELIAIAAMVLVVVVLGVLQYQWTGEIGRTEQERLKGSLNTSVRDFNQEFSYDFERMCEAFWINPDTPPSELESRVQRQYSNWYKMASSPGLLAGLYLWRTGGPPGPRLESLDPVTERFQQSAWPAQLDSLHRWIDQQSGQQTTIGDREAVYYPWTIVEGALVRPLFQIASGQRDASAGVQPAGFLIVQLSDSLLQRQYFPDLVERHFGSAGQRNFAVAVRSARAPYQTIYTSDPAFAASASSPDATVNLFDSVSEEARRRGRPPLQASDTARQWVLVAQHPAGSLDVAVVAWRRRSLVISFTLLAFLAASMALIFSVARRAEHLAKLQMDFVTGFSHELCTPLAVINSAAENLVDGVVAEPQKIQEYGGLIRDQSQRLERLVDEVLQFAAERSGRSKYEPRPIEIAAVLARSLDASGPGLRDAGFTVEKEIGANLPLVFADPAALGRCLDNLLSNAMKYSSANRWIAVRARVAPASPQGEVQVSVQDRGEGIPATDLPHVFEPFYRVQSAREGPVRGVGLGLYLVKRMMEGMGGRVSVSSEPGRGSFFTLHIPVLQSAQHRQGGTA